MELWKSYCLGLLGACVATSGWGCILKPRAVQASVIHSQWWDGDGAEGEARRKSPVARKPSTPGREGSLLPPPLGGSRALMSHLALYPEPAEPTSCSFPDTCSWQCLWSPVLVYCPGSLLSFSWVPIPCRCLNACSPSNPMQYIWRHVLSCLFVSRSVCVCDMIWRIHLESLPPSVSQASPSICVPIRDCAFRLSPAPNEPTNAFKIPSYSCYTGVSSCAICLV